MKDQENNKKFERLMQTEMPRATLREGYRLAEALRDNFAGKNARPIDLAKAVNWSPSSSGWRTLTGATVAYGLTDNAYNATFISLTTLGEQTVKPTAEGEDKRGLMTALLRPTIAKAFYEKYDGAKFPKDDIARNVLNQLGVPQDRTEEALKIIIDNAKFVGVMTEVSGSPYIQLTNVSAPNTVTSDLAPIPNGQAGKLVDTRPLIPTPPSQPNLNADTFPFVDGQIAVILSKEVQQKGWLNKELSEKVQALMQSAQALADEWKKGNQSDGKA